MDRGMGSMKQGFEKAFSAYQKNLIAIYGLGSMTRDILEQVGNCLQIVGLLDGYQTQGEMYGYPIMALEETVEHRISMIIIAARPSSCRIIVNRIRGFCEKNRIRLFDIEGNELLLRDSVSVSGAKQFFGQVGISREKLLQQIDAHEAISFDVFNTLLIRRVLYPEDVFEMVERRAAALGRKRFGFSRERQLAERELSRNGVPGWEDIYKRLQEKNGLSTGETEELKRLEWETERAVLKRREEVCHILEYAAERGKSIYLLSDMYFSQEQMEGLLAQNGISQYRKLLVSNEYGTSKEEQLFACLLREAGTDSILHIGDDWQADVISAKENGIHSFYIPAPDELLEQSGLVRALESECTLEEHVKLGMFAAELFDDPFCHKGADSPERLGYLIFAPILTDFAFWMQRSITDDEVNTVLYGARDGYLIRQLLEECRRRSGKERQNIYFLTSRASAVLAGIRREEEIDYAVGIGFSGSFEQMLKRRFCLTEEEIRAGEADIVEYYPAILRKAKEKRESYRAYIAALGLPPGRKAFFDFVSSGTCQMALENIMDEKLKGFYFMRIDEAYDKKKELCIKSFYSADSIGGKEIDKDYFILENILASSYPSLQGFDGDGEPRYFSEDRTKEEIEFIQRVQSGIMKYFCETLDIWGNGEPGDGREVSEFLLGLYHQLPVEADIFREMQWSDIFYGRSAKIREML